MKKGQRIKLGQVGCEERYEVGEFGPLRLFSHIFGFGANSHGVETCANSYRHPVFPFSLCQVGLFYTFALSQKAHKIGE